MGETFALNTDFTISIAKVDLYDSALLAQVAGQRIFNINDCPLSNRAVLNSFVDKHGQCDVLLTQFSYAA